MERAQSSPRRAGTEQSGISSDDDPVAQSAEQLPFKQWVRGSNPRRVTIGEPDELCTIYLSEQRFVLVLLLLNIETLRFMS